MYLARLLVFILMFFLSLSVMFSTRTEASSLSPEVEAARQKLIEAERRREEAERKKEEDLRAEEARRLEEALKKGGFIAFSEPRMNYTDAVAFCRSHGGRLPRINDSDSWDGKNPPERGVLIDGFGYGGRLVRDIGLPAADYWTGTVYSADQDGVWSIDAGISQLYFMPSAWNVKKMGDKASDRFRVVCVP